MKMKRKRKNAIHVKHRKQRGTRTTENAEKLVSHMCLILGPFCGKSIFGARKGRGPRQGSKTKRKRKGGGGEKNKCKNEKRCKQEQLEKGK